ncbi:MAG: hypothetical protein BZ137_01430 [Methanosphaera sp. rholeuAM130]|nr:MAG: hypothetical protein BZ137_01430 [Methanosphaera sp. rholeuAM130]
MIKVNKKFIPGIIILIFLLIPITVISIDLPNNMNYTELNRSELNVSAEESFDLEIITLEIRTHSSYKNHDNDTLKWMESLQNKKVFTARKYFVIMDASEANKLPTEVITDSIIYDEFDCYVIANRSLGDGLKDVLYVKDVQFKKQGIIPFHEYEWENDTN